MSGPLLQSTILNGRNEWRTGHGPADRLNANPVFYGHFYLLHFFRQKHKPECAHANRHRIILIGDGVFAWRTQPASTKRREVLRERDSGGEFYSTFHLVPRQNVFATFLSHAPREWKWMRKSLWVTFSISWVHRALAHPRRCRHSDKVESFHSPTHTHPCTRRIQLHGCR